MPSKNLKRNTGTTAKKHKPASHWVNKEKKKSEKKLARTAKKLKTAPDIKTPAQKRAAKKFQAAEIKAHKTYLKDLEKSVKAHKGGTQRGKAFASQHKTRVTLMGRKLNKLKSGLSISAKNS